MNKSEIMQHIAEIGVIPVVRAESADIALRAIDAIRAGGISVLEITMTVPGAIRIIEEVAQKLGSKAVVGAGTVLDEVTARQCILAGAQFIVSPALNLDTISCCHRYGIVVIPGAMTPTEVVTASSAGADWVKVFPAGALGGPSYIKALKAPLPHIQLVPTGGVSLKTAADFILAGAIALGVGTDLVDTKALRDGEDRLITQRARQFVEVVKEARSELKGARAATSVGDGR
ncbi:MAG: 2-dehydro-3-deoxyphosphogluconate aldolase [Acidobacteria bacterium]|nr:MAG: 2-dehydro-3-deoxyphosphogluconate aldolase [Acidobacteriota bacterium]